MEGRVCMNGACASSDSLAWKEGWPLRSGELATLCDNCGDAYKQLIFCEMFHSEDTGWRECATCGKRLHCGCIASCSLLEVLDTGGVNCIGCTKSSKLPSTPSKGKTKAYGLSTAGISHCIDKVPSGHSGDDAKHICVVHLPPSKNVDTTPLKPEEYIPEVLSSFNISSADPPKDFEALQEIMVQTNLSIGLSVSSNSNPLPRLIAEEREFCTAISPFKQLCKPFHLSPRLQTSVLAAGLEKNSSNISQLRVARPPVEGRVKNQLLPRYWPRITDLELQQISGDSNSIIIPLFEKVLSASDAGRIGRLVLPKACAEAYFPPISQAEGLPLRIQDVTGNEWVFQFRFWPNNNSRMYVLEGVTPCIQSMQLQAGDTVTFSRMEPEGKLLMGFRKASSNIPAQQDSYISAMNSYAFQSDPPLTAAENLNLMSCYSGLHCSLKGSRNTSVAMLSTQGLNTENNESKLGENLLPLTLLLPEHKRNRNIGSKSKRLLIDGHDAVELKHSWEEVQDLLRPPPSVKPSTITVEEHEFEEYEEPPVFGKRSIFLVHLSGEHEQWAQCDSCFKWRKLPVDILLSSKWTCQDNVQDRARSSCSSPDELGFRELENLLRMNKEFKKQRIAASLKLQQADASDDLGALANAAAIDGETSEPAYVAAITTKHPRHRPGCSCIVCIQPPSGKGKHKPTCICNVCLTVKRRFKTLMMRKKKRQSEREAEISHRNQFASADKEETEVDSIPRQVMSQRGNGRSESEPFFSCRSDSQSQEYTEILKGRGLDLNCCPDREHTAEPSRISMMSLLQEASLPLDTYLRQNGLTRLGNSEQQAISPGETAQEDHGLFTAVQAHEDGRTLNEEKTPHSDSPLT